MLTKLNVDWAEHNAGELEKGVENDPGRFKRVFEGARDQLLDVGKIKEKVDFDQANDALYYVRMDKTEGKAARKLNAVDPGEVLRAYYRCLGWSC